MDFTRGLTTARETLRKRQRSLSKDRPKMCDLRIVLLGTTVEANSRVGNAILGRAAFESTAHPPDVEQQSERVRGKLEERYITVINTPHLLHRELSLIQITQAVKECVFLSAPGPHVLILILQCYGFKEEDIKRVKTVLNFFSDQAIKRTIVLTIDEKRHSSKQVKKHQFINQLIEDCGGGCVKFNNKKKGWHSEIFEKIDKVCRESGKDFLICDIYEEAEDKISVETEESRRTHSSVRTEGERGKEHEAGLTMLKEMWTVSEQSPAAVHPKMSKLNLVLCGNDKILKGSISNLILGERTSKPCSMCEVQEGKVSGRPITLVELPALFKTHLSEEEVVHETFHCVSLCDPGVHAFLIVIPDGPLTDEGKEEIEKITTLFHTTDHLILLSTAVYIDEGPVTDFVKSSTDCQKLIWQSGVQYKVVGLKEYGNSEKLLDYIETTMTEPYSLHMYMKAQVQRVRCELEEKHNEEVRKMQNKIKELEQKIGSEDVQDVLSDSNCLRIVLIGKTGNGKSETGNTILGRDTFYTEASSDSVTTVCVKGTGEFEGKSIAVVDTPGLFDTTLSNEQIQEEIVKCISLSAPGPHVFIIVLSVGRFTKEEKDTVDWIKLIFGPKAAQFSIVLFTRGDDLENKTIEEFIAKSQNAGLKKLIRDCGDRFLAFNNKEKQDKTQVTHLLNMIDNVKKSSQDKYFTNSMFQEAEMCIKKKVEEILKEKEREIQIQKEQLKAQYDSEMETMIKRLEEEKKRADEERLQMESKFREKEDALRKEFEEKEKTEERKREMDEQNRLDEEKQKKAVYHQKIEELNKEVENQRLQFKKEFKKREKEDKEREEKYKEDQEQLKREQKQVMEELKKKQSEETERRELDNKRRIKEEEEERKRWERKIKEAENDKKESQEEIKRQQKEWEMEKKKEMREQKEEERKRSKKHKEQLTEKQEELEKLRKKFEKEREEDREQRVEERKRWREAEEKQREQNKREYEERKNKIEKHYEQLVREMKEEWERIKREEDAKKEEERESWKKQIEDIKQEVNELNKKEEEQKNKEKKELKKMNQKHTEEINKLKKQYEDDARKKAEESPSTEEGETTKKGENKTCMIL